MNSHALNFATLCAAAKAGDLVLVEAKNKASGRKAALICARTITAAPQPDRDGSASLTPLAVMLEGNPVADYEPLEGIEEAPLPAAGRELGKLADVYAEEARQDEEYGRDRNG